MKPFVKGYPAEKADGHHVSVVVPSIGRESLSALHESLGRQTRQPDEIIIVRDDRRQGPAWARNQGIKRSRGDLIAFIDDDCEPPPEWLERLIAAFDRHDAAGAGGTYDESEPILRDKRRRRPFPDDEVVDSVGWVGVGGNVAYRRDWLERLEARDGYIFNESFKTGQDFELNWRLRGCGGKMIYVPVRVKHHKPLTRFGYLSYQFERGAGIARLFNAQRTNSMLVADRRSLIWNADGRPPGRNWLLVLWRKGFGPFDIGNFGRKGDFLLFWMGEKIQGMGFFWGLIGERFGFVGPGTPQPADPNDENLSDQR